MIRRFRSKALKRFATAGDASKLPVAQVERVRVLLAAIDAVRSPEALRMPGFRLHALQGRPRRYAVDASANYRITFAFDGEDAVDVDIEDYR